MTVEIKTSGTTWVVPPGVTSADFECYAGGMGGYAGFGVANGGGSGGQGGGYAKVTLSLTPGATVYLNIGAGGLGGPSSVVAPTDGGDTWVNKTSNAAPTSTTNGAKAAGGTAAPGTPTQVGTVVRTSAWGFDSPSDSGGGGSGAAGSSANGSAATSPTGGAGGGGQAGAGGNGATSSAAPGGAGNNYGAGGGGGFGSKSNGTSSGGDGAQGCIVITYTPAAIGRSYGFISC